MNFQQEVANQRVFRPILKKNGKLISKTTEKGREWYQNSDITLNANNLEKNQNQSYHIWRSRLLVKLIKFHDKESIISQVALRFLNLRIKSKVTVIEKVIESIS